MSCLQAGVVWALDPQGISCAVAAITPCFLMVIPSGKRLHNYGQSPFLMGKSTISMAMFNSYVCLPEGIRNYCSLMTILGIQPTEIGPKINVEMLVIYSKQQEWWYNFGYIIGYSY